MCVYIMVFLGSILGSVFFIALLSLAVFYRKSKCGRAERPCELLGLYERVGRVVISRRFLCNTNWFSIGRS